MPPSWNTALYMAVYVVLIENELASQISYFNLQSSGILPDSTDTRSILNVNGEEGYLLQQIAKVLQQASCA